MARCLITGCELINPENPNQYIHGDLHEQGDQLIFNGCRDDKGEAAAIDGKMHTGARAISIVGDMNYFERKAVFVIARDCVEFNDAAAEYLRRWP